MGRAQIAEKAHAGPYPKSREAPPTPLRIYDTHRVKIAVSILLDRLALKRVLTTALPLRCRMPDFPIFTSETDSMNLRSKLMWLGGIFASLCSILFPAFVQEPAKKLADRLGIDELIVDYLNQAAPWLSAMASNRYLLAIFMLALGFAAHWGIVRNSRFKAPKTSITENGLKTIILVKDGAVYDGFLDKPPGFSGRFSANGRNGQLYLEVSGYYLDVMGDNGWTVPAKFLISDFARYVEGQRIAVPLIHSEERSNNLVWFFGPSGTNERCRLSIGKDIHYRGRVTFVSDADVEQHWYFISHAVHDYGVRPNITSQHMWAHALDWERRVG